MRGWWLLFLFVLPLPAVAAEAPAPVAGIVREWAAIPLDANDAASPRLEALVTRPVAPGHYPIVVISHGSPRNAADRASTAPSGYSAIALAFARSGWIAVAASRRVYGRSSPIYAEGSGSCRNPDYTAAGLQSATDILATAEFARRLADADPARPLLIGVSAGGFGSIAAASLRPAGLTAVVNFAGGRGSIADDTVCAEGNLVDAYGRYGAGVRVPTLWVYAENDKFFGPALARRMFDSFTAAGGRGELAMAPPFGRDGHALFNGDPAAWRDTVNAFLARHALPPLVPRDAALRPQLAPPPGLGEGGRREFERYLTSENYEKAFAIGRGGAFAWRSGQRSIDEAAMLALAACRADADCRLYAVNDRLAE